MVVKVYISGISGNKEVKKRQQRVLMILDSKSIKYDVIDITEPGREADKDFMQSNSKSNGGTVSDPNPRSPLPPQLFNDEEYCGDYDQFDLANEVDTLEQFLKMEVPPEETPQAESEKPNNINGDVNETNLESQDNKEAVETSEEQVADDTVDKTESTVKEDSPVTENSPSKETESKASKEGTPVKDESADGDAKEKTPEIESEERQKSVEKESTPEEKAVSPEKEIEKTTFESKESSPEKEAVNENGTVSSREQSQDKETPEKEIESKKDSPSDTLIQSEQAAAAE